MKMNSIKTARFDTKMSASHKLLLEEAARLKGFKNLTEYVITTMVTDATSAIDQYRHVLYSVNDKNRIMKILSQPTELSSSFLKASERRSKKLMNEISDKTTGQET